MSVTAPNDPGLFVDPGLATDPNILKQRVIAYLEAYMPPGWAPSPLIDLIIEAICQEAAVQADVASQKLLSDFRYFGTLVNLPPIDAVPATAVTTFTVKDNAGYTIPAGSVVGAQDPNGVLQGFDLTADLVIPGGSTSGAGATIAEIAGVVGNGLSGSAQLVQCPAFVTAASLATSSGGIDAEDDPVYLQRLTETLQLLTPEPILPANFAVLARSVPGVFRATAVDLLKPGPPYDGAAEATGQEKNVTVAVTDVNGASVGSTIRGLVAAKLKAMREQNFVVWCVDPQYGTIDVDGDVYAWPGWATTDVHDRVVAALQVALSPAVFATDPSGNAARWANDPILRLSMLHEAIMSVQGVRYVEPFTFGLHGGALATTDVTLGAGSAIPALPLAGTLTIRAHPTT